MSDTVDRIKERLTIVDVVQPYVKLTRAGKYWKGLSPFTREKTPSFFVTPEKGLYHCFSTGKGGDMFTFIEEMERVDFKGALKILAERAGVEIVRESKESRDEREQLFAALEAATVFFEETLTRTDAARTYLSERGLEAATIAHWRVGYAPKDWHALKEHLSGKGFSESTLLAAGLIKRPDRADGSTDEKRTYARFRGRIMFPIFDASGRTIAFSGRIFEDNPAHPQAKYLNSPEGLLFDKSRALYGIQDAKSTARTLGFSMLVEGQVDLLLVHQLGYRCAVATSGTACTASHAEVLKRYSENVLLSYDGDKAGIEASYRAALLFLDAGMNVKVVALPEGADPADMVLKDPGGFKERVRSALPVVDFFVRVVQQRAKDDRAALLEVGAVVLPLIAKMHNALDQAHALRHISEAVRVPEEALRVELSKITKGEPLTTLGGNPFFVDDARESLLFGILRTYEDAQNKNAPRVEAAFINEFGRERLEANRARGDSYEEAARIIASENFFTLLPSTSAEEAKLTEVLDERKPERTRMRARYDVLIKELTRAEHEHNEAEVARLMEELRTLSKKLE